MSHHTCIAWRITCVPVMYHMAHYVCITCRIACVVSHQHNRTLLLRAPLALAVYHAATHCCVSRQHERTLLLRAPLAPRCASCNDASLCHTNTNERCCFALPRPLVVCHATTHRCVSRQHERATLLRAPMAPRCVMRRHVVVLHLHNRTLLLRAPLAHRCVSCSDIS